MTMTTMWLFLALLLGQQSLDNNNIIYALASSSLNRQGKDEQVSKSHLRKQQQQDQNIDNSNTNNELWQAQQNAWRKLVKAQDDDEDILTPLYFGVGCFWHIQHEFVQAERDILNRNDRQLTSRTGFAGGKRTGSMGRVCYHNYQGIGDYASLGYGEAVGMAIPENKIEDFAKVYFSLFSPKTGERVDAGDRGREYRSMVGLPGGSNHPQYNAILAAAEEKGFRLEMGEGDDPDTYGKNKLVYVYDSNVFPFYQAEVYHQYHNDFRSPPYEQSYNNLADLAVEDGRVVGTGCPDRM